MADTETHLEGFELSAQQARLWRTVGAEARAELHLRVPPGTDAARVRSSLEQVIARHEILRTSYRCLPGMSVPVQVIGERAGDGDVALAIDEDRIVLRLPAAHADASSLLELAAAWSRAYAGTALAGEPLQYADYAAWRNELAAGRPEARAFWERELALRAPATPLPLRRAPSTSAAAPLACHAIELPAPLREAWARCASALGVDPAIALLAAWIAVCDRHAESDRLTLGLDWQARGEHLGDGLGLFAEPLPLTVDLGPGVGPSSSAAELCRWLDGRRAELCDWRDYLPAIEGEAPIGFRRVPPAPALAAGWSIEHAQGPTAAARLLLEVRGDVVALHHDEALYGAGAAAVIADQVRAALAALCADPARPVRALDLVTAAERRYLDDVASRGAPLPREREDVYRRVAGMPSLGAFLAESFRKRAAAPAVCAAGGVLSYAALDEQAARLAAALVAHGVQRGDRVAHVLPRDLDAVVAMLAILRAGAVYVPIDPEYPEQRTGFLLADCGARVAITRQALVSRLPEAWRDGRMVLTDRPSAAPPVDFAPVQPDDVAYLIYTSGSTGEPKGVPITHGAALHSLAARLAYYPTRAQRFLLLSSFSFDSSVAGLFWTLAQGGCLHVATEAEQRDATRIAERVVADEITHLLALPSVHHLVLAQLAGRRASLDTAIVAGEACPVSLVDAHHRALPGVRLYNEYGPTEASVWSTVAACQPGVASVPIGRPIPGSRVHVLDERGAPVARGVRGEVHIGGPGLSAGYLDRPALTADRFVSIRGERLYRTGDLAAWDEHGELHFLGRGDAQVKLRGFRVELGEIEAALGRVTGAENVAVVAQRAHGDGGDGDVRLRGFVESTRPWDEAAVRRELAALLPAHMIPVDLDALSALPRTANGKIDRAALAALETRRRAAFASPVGATERTLAALWTELLGERAGEVGRDDDFFALGGHSLLVVRLVHRIRTALHRDVPVSSVFEHPTLAALAAAVDGHARRRIVPLGAGDAPASPPVLYAIHDAAGSVHRYAPLAAALSCEVRGLVVDPGDATDIASLAASHVAAMRAAQAGPYHLCGWSVGGLIAHEIARQLEAAGERVAFLALIDTTPEVGDEPLSFEALVARARAELDPASAERFAALPAAALAELRAATAEQPPVAQMRGFLAWAARHDLAVAAPEAIDAALEAMATARRWVAAHRPAVVAADVHHWWAHETLRRAPALPATWRAFTRGAAHSAIVAGEHDDLLASPELHASLAAALRATAGGGS